jgi:protein TonB
VPIPPSGERIIGFPGATPIDEVSPERMQTGSHATFSSLAVARLPIPWAAEAAKDRLSSTLFLAGLFHAIVILGVTFSGDLTGPNPNTATKLDVVLVTRDYEERLAPEEAELLAQQNLSGAGNTRMPNELKSAVNHDPETDMIGPMQDGVLEEQFEGADEPDRQPLIVAVSANPDSRHERQGASAPTAQQRRTLPSEITAIEILSEPAAETLITDTRTRELIISANTRESRIAAYLTSWKVKVERAGTLNFPTVARNAGQSRFPTLEVAINANGDLREVLVKNSSGQRVLDQAAMNILRSAAPFEPFPEFLRSDYDSLRFAYEWRFTGSGTTSNIAAVGGS